MIWLDGKPERLHGAEYLIARHRATGGNPPPMMHLIKLEDIYERLDPRRESVYLNQMGRANALPRFVALENGLAFDKVWGKAIKDRYPSSRCIWIYCRSLIPLCRVFLLRWLGQGCRLRGLMQMPTNPRLLTS